MATRTSRYLAVIGGGALLATSLVACSTGGEGDDARALNIVMNNNPWAAEVMALIPEFEAETGIKVEANTYNDEQIDQLYNVKLNAGSDEIDVLVYRPLQNIMEFQVSGYLEPLDDYVGQSAEWDWDDFQNPARDSVTVDGSIYGVPITTEVGVLFYRTDLLEKAGLEVPKTMDELAAAVAAVHDPDNGIYGYAARGETSAAVSQFANYLYSFGGDWTDAQGKAAINSPAAIQAFEFFGGLQHQYGPPGAVDMSWPQVMGLFQQGLVAFDHDASSLYPNAVSAENSVVADVTGVAQIPAGPAGSKPYSITSFALGVSAFSSQKDKAWIFTEWITSKDRTLAFQKNGNPGARASVWANPESTSSMPGDLLSVTQASNEVGVGHDRPKVVGVSASRAIVGKPLVAAILGQDVKAAADAANAEFQELLDREAR